jgi:dTDP-4-dehydrorhamnose 3,5-epimerase
MLRAMKFDPTPLSGALVLTLPAHADARGLFVKTFHDALFKAADVEFTLRESYFSISERNVIRGMHFQLPPHQHSKIVFCPRGAILDVIVDLRRESPTYGQYLAQELSADNHKAFFIPEGFAHGFKALTEGAMTYYLVSATTALDLTGRQIIPCCLRAIFHLTGWKILTARLCSRKHESAAAARESVCL